jgi:uncharacterized membrane protein YphA (DoxX/SURF4 family)
MNTLFKPAASAPGFAILQKCNDYLFGRHYDASALVCLRIGTGIILLLQLLQLLPDLRALTGSEGLIRPDISGVAVPAYVLTTTRIAEWLGRIASIPSATALQVLAITYVLCLVFIVLGMFTRLSAALCLLLHVGFIYSSHFFSYGVDYFLNIFLFYLCVFPVNREYAIDKYLFRLKAVNYTPYIRLLQWHLCIVYFVGGVAKTFGINWWNGISIWKAINRPAISSHDISFLSHYAWLFTLTGIAVMLAEALYPVFIHIRRTRRLWLLLSCLFHLGIAILLRLPFFAAVMILFNAVAFYLPQKKTVTRL